MPRKHQSPQKRSKAAAPPKQSRYAQNSDSEEMFDEPLVKNKLIISIDYGTTFTSVAYKFFEHGKSERYGSLKTRLDSVGVVSTWQGKPGETSTVPTKIVYAAADHSIWIGHQIEPAVSVFPLLYFDGLRSILSYLS